MTTALIIVDLQNDFVGDDIFGDGALSCQDGPQTAVRISKMDLSPYSYVLTTQDWHVEPGDHFKEWPEHCVAGTRGAELVEELDNVRIDAKFFKGQYTGAYSGFEGRDLNGIPLREWLTSHGVTQVVIVGLALEYCVKATAIDATFRGFDTQVLMPFTSSVKGGPVVGEAIRTMELMGVKLVQDVVPV